ncbi:MAG: hypothetical protein H7Y42_08670 [Chitinophagaceae bacterium]|nr:hypothetical protein [Chitinophagaceae bacterium]
MHEFKPISVLAISLLILLLSCNNNTDSHPEDGPQSDYFDYHIWGDEESGNITVKLQFRFAGPNGMTKLLELPSKVELDGIPLEVDSSRWNGYYYEITHPVSGFAGRHKITYTDARRKQYVEEFDFHPLSFTTELPHVIQRGDIKVELNGLGDGDIIRVLLTDTASFSEGIVRTDTVTGGQIQITRSELTQVTNGPVSFEIWREEERRVKSGTRRGGRISIVYGLRTEFELKD